MLNKIKYVPALLTAVALLVLSAPSQALVIIDASLSANNLRFSSTNPLAELSWTDEWQGIVRAQAQDTDSGIDAESDSIISNAAALNVSASTAFVNSDARYQVINGDQVAIGDGEVAVETNADLAIFDHGKQGDGEAVASFDNFFVVTGGAPGESVEVSFELDFSYSIEALADPLGFFEVFVATLLRIEDLDGLDEPVGADLFVRTASGSNTAFAESGGGVLSVTALLEFEREYFLFGSADSEVFGFNRIPEPGTLVLVMAGLSLIVRCRRRR